jgi:protein-disulfide isomerase
MRVMMRGPLLVAAGFLAFLASVSADSLAPVAVLDGKPITYAGLKAIVGDQDFRLRTELYEQQRRTLEQYIDGQLLVRESARRGTTPAAVVEEIVRAGTAPVGEVDVNAVLADPPAHMQGLDAESIRSVLTARRAEWATRRFMRALRRKEGARVLLEPPRAQMDLSLSPGTLPQGAPVTLVVFSDFACPACARFQDTVDRLMQLYPLELRIVYRAFPEASRPLGALAAEAALCAHAQGRYWEMHRRLFRGSEALSAAAIATHAHEIDLDAAAFEACLGQGHQRARVDRDVADGSRLGVRVTPSVFVNGRLLLEPSSEENLREAIEDELE